MLGIQLTDFDVGSVPLLRTDQYGNFIPDARRLCRRSSPASALDGIPNTADDIVVSGTPAAPVNPTTAGAIRTGHAFLADIAHEAVPVGKIADGDITIGLANPGQRRHRVRQRAARRPLHRRRRPREREYRPHRGPSCLPCRAQPAGRAHQRNCPRHRRPRLHQRVARERHWRSAYRPEQVDALVWDGERLFQAAKFGTEMQYQHLVFEEFARKVQPQHQRLPRARRLRHDDRSVDRRRVRARGLPLRPLHADRVDRPLRSDLHREPHRPDRGLPQSGRSSTSRSTRSPTTSPPAPSSAA